MCAFIHINISVDLIFEVACRTSGSFPADVGRPLFPCGGLFEEEGTSGLCYLLNPFLFVVSFHINAFPCHSSLAAPFGKSRRLSRNGAFHLFYADSHVPIQALPFFFFLKRAACSAL